jgi:vacuolar-type H+-ATPase subunit I/STV1
VYIQVNVIGGEVNDENKSAVDCMYQGESLGDKLARLLNEALYLPWTMNNSRIFFDITQGEAKSQIEKQEKEKKEKEEKAKSPSEKKGGRTRTFRERLIKTRRLYRLS